MLYSIFLSLSQRICMDNNSILKSPGGKSLPKHGRMEKQISSQHSEMSFESRAEAQLRTIKKSRSKGLSYSQKKPTMVGKAKNQQTGQLDHQFMLYERDQFFEEQSLYDGLILREQTEKIEKFSVFSLSSDKNEMKTLYQKTKTRTIGTQYEIQPIASGTYPNKDQLPNYQKFVSEAKEKFKFIFAKINNLESSKTNEIQTPIDGKNQRKYRRKATDINRKYECGIQGCNKRYGSRSSVKIHIKIVHNISKSLIKIVNNVAQRVDNKIQEQPDLS